MVEFKCKTLAIMSKGMFGGKRAQCFIKRTLLQLLRDGSILLWTCVADISLMRGKMDSVKYRRILKANIRSSVKKLKMKRG